MNMVNATTRVGRLLSRWDFLLIVPLILTAGCATTQSVGSVGRIEPRKGDEIVVAGQFFHTGTPVVLWLDPAGYDAYRVERRFAPFEKSSWSNSVGEVKT